MAAIELDNVKDHRSLQERPRTEFNAVNQQTKVLTIITPEDSWF